MANDKLPTNNIEWDHLARKYNVEKRSLRMNLKLHSASNVSYKQYLLFRTILPASVPKTRFDPRLLGISHLMPTADQILNGPKFVDYLANIPAYWTQPNATWAGEDLFRTAATWQGHLNYEQKMGTRFEGSKEASVNAAFLAFLTAIAALLDQPIKRQWSTARRKLTADFGTPQRKRQYVAYTDGQLEEVSSHRILALVECKSGPRGRHSPGVDMQEVAQLVAWVKQHPAGPGANRRVLLSKDGLELYISVFQYGPGWLRYLNGGPGSIKHAGFAYMQRYGPWNMKNKADLREFALIVIALLLL